MSNTTLPFKNGQIQSQEFGMTDFAKSPAGIAAYGVGRGHEGIDVFSEIDSTISSISDGTVILDNDSFNGLDSGLFASYGNFVVIKDDDTNRAWYYCHLDSNIVNIGQKVKAGDKIGIMGGSGSGSRSKWGPHLHLGRAELDANNSRINKNSISYGFIDGTDDLKKAIAKFNNQQQSMQEDTKLIVREAIKQGLNFDTQSGKEKIAYILATAKHESDNFATLEEYADGSAYEGRSDLGNNQKGDGVKYKGRGYVQITGRNNYKKYAEITGKDLVNNPRLAQEDKTLAAFILVHGMITGGFTGKSLSTYPYTYQDEDLEVKTGKAKAGEAGIDFYEARRIVNGTDKATLIAGYANEYMEGINTGKIIIPQPQPDDNVKYSEELIAKAKSIITDPIHLNHILGSIQLVKDQGLGNILGDYCDRYKDLNIYYGLSETQKAEIENLKAKIIQLEAQSTVTVTPTDPRVEQLQKQLEEANKQRELEALKNNTLVKKSTDNLVNSKTFWTLLLPMLGSSGTAIANYLQVINFDWCLISFSLNGLFIFASILVIYYKKIDQNIIKNSLDSIIKTTPDIIKTGETLASILKK